MQLNKEDTQRTSLNGKLGSYEIHDGNGNRPSLNKRLISRTRNSLILGAFLCRPLQNSNVR